MKKEEERAFFLLLAATFKAGTKIARAFDFLRFSCDFFSRYDTALNA
jgi:hypothetical protein